MPYSILKGLKKQTLSGFECGMKQSRAGRKLWVAGAWLYSIGVPEKSIIEHEKALKSDKFLVIAHGTADEMAKANRILEMTCAAQVAVHRDRANHA
jgi:predicted alpha/beta-hydrolase family hydrolase